MAIPLLCLQALDDPIAPKEAIPYEVRCAVSVALHTKSCGCALSDAQTVCLMSVCVMHPVNGCTSLVLCKHISQITHSHSHVQALSENPNCVLATTPCGGHLGWVSGSDGPLEAPWSNEVMMQWLVSVMQATKEGIQLGGGSVPPAAGVSSEAGAEVDLQAAVTVSAK